jgi:hypothetical protein
MLFQTHKLLLQSQAVLFQIYEMLPVGHEMQIRRHEMLTRAKNGCFGVTKLHSRATKLFSSATTRCSKGTVAPKPALQLQCAFPEQGKAAPEPHSVVSVNETCLRTTEPHSRTTILVDLELQQMMRSHKTLLPSRNGASEQRSP